VPVEQEGKGKGRRSRSCWRRPARRRWRRKAVSKEILLNRLQVRDSERIVDEYEGGLATFDGKKTKVENKIREWRAEGPIRKRKQRNVRREGLVDPVRTQSPSQQRHGPNLLGAVHNVCDAERWGFQGGAHLWHWPTMRGRSACLQLGNLGRGGRDLVIREKETEHNA